MLDARCSNDSPPREVSMTAVSPSKLTKMCGPSNFCLCKEYQYRGAGW